MRRFALALALAAAGLAGCATPSVASQDPALPSTSVPVEDARSFTTEQFPAAQRDRARALIEDAMVADGIPGMSVAVYRDGDLVWSEGLGFANVELEAPVTRDTLFRTGSVAKAVTGTIAARLAARGDLDLDRPIREYLPEWPEKHPPITTRQLLGHLGGIRHYEEREANPFGEDAIDFMVYPDRASVLAIFAEDPLVAPPGEKFHYSTYSFTLASLVMEATTGKSFAQLLHDEVTGPGGIDGLRLDNFLAMVPHRASFYDKPIEQLMAAVPGDTMPDAVDLAVSLPVNPAYKYAGGGMLATAEGLARLGSLHYAPGFLSEEAFALAMTPQRYAAGKETRTGLAWGTRPDAFGRHAVGHSGSQQGARAILVIYPEQRISIALMSNLGFYPLDIAGLAAAIMDITQGGTGSPPANQE